MFVKRRGSSRRGMLYLVEVERAEPERINIARCEPKDGHMPMALPRAPRQSLRILLRLEPLLSRSGP